MLFFCLGIQAGFPVLQVSFVDAFFLDDTLNGYHIVHHLGIESAQFACFDAQSLAVVAAHQEHLLGTMATSMSTYTFYHNGLFHQVGRFFHHFVDAHCYFLSVLCLLLTATARHHCKTCCYEKSSHHQFSFHNPVFLILLLIFSSIPFRCLQIYESCSDKQTYF